MNISIFGTRGFPEIQGGVEKHCENLYPLISDKLTFTIFRRKSFVKVRDENKSLYNNIRFIDLPSTQIKGIEALFHSFLCSIYCLFQRPDIVHIHNIGPGLFIPILKIFGLKVILTYHSPNYEHKKWGMLARTILRLGEYLSLNYADKVIFVNKIQMKKFSKDIQAKSIFVPNGIKIAYPSKESDYIESLGLSSHQYILAVGRITQEKGFDYLIDAYLSSTVKSDYKLVIAGGSDHKSVYSENLVKAVADNPIILTGHIDGEPLRQLYTYARLFVLPSYNEGFPLVLLEAMSYKLPILASDISGNRQIGLSEEYYFKVGDKTMLANKIEEELRRGTIPRTYPQKIYTWDEVGKQVYDIYKTVL